MTIPTCRVEFGPWTTGMCSLSLLVLSEPPPDHSGLFELTLKCNFGFSPQTGFYEGVRGRVMGGGVDSPSI